KNMKKMLSVILSAFMLMQVMIFAVTADTAEYNVGLYAAAFAYGSQAGTKPGNAVDGDAATSWMSGNISADYKDYLTLDLGGVYPLSALFINLAEGSGQNFTVYGAADGALAERTAVTAKLTALEPGILTSVPLESNAGYRYLIFEQDAEETAFGFNEIEVYTTADTTDHITGGPAAEIAVNANRIWYVNYPGYAQGNGGKEKLPNLVDSDPSTSYSVSANGQTVPQGMIMLDLGEAKTVSHLVWQGSSRDTNGAGYDTISKLKIVASNDDKAYLEGGQWVEISEITNPATYATGDGKYDTGLLVFDLVAALGETPYRYIGIIKEEPTPGLGTIIRLGAGTLKVFERTGPPIPKINIAHNKAAFSYSSVAGTTPALALDGDPKSYWESQNVADILHDQFVIDLGQANLIDSIYVQLANENSADEFTIYGANSVPESGKIKLADVQNASANGSIVYEAGTASYRYIIFDKAPSDRPLGFAEVEVYAQALSAGSEMPVSLISEGKTVIGSTYSDLGTWDITAKDTAVMTDNNPQTFKGGSVGLATGARSVAIFVDLEMKVPISHVIWQGIARGDDNPVSSENESLTNFQIVGTNDAPSQGMKWTVLASKTGYPYVGERIATDLYNSADPEVYDTGLYIFPVDSSSYRYIGIVKTESATPDNIARYIVNTLQVYAKSSDVVDYVESTGENRIVSSEKGTVSDTEVSYTASMLNGAYSAAVIGLFGQYDDSGKLMATAYAGGRIPPVGSFGTLGLTSAVADGKSGTWDLAILDGLKVIDYISNLPKLTRKTMHADSNAGTVSYV
ncbi:MAG: discoidin domain-containing protein, partial [Clostridia bacterium]